MGLNPRALLTPKVITTMVVVVLGIASIFVLGIFLTHLMETKTVGEPVKPIEAYIKKDLPPTVSVQFIKWFPVEEQEDATFKVRVKYRTFAAPAKDLKAKGDQKPATDGKTDIPPDGKPKTDAKPDPASTQAPAANVSFQHDKVFHYESSGKVISAKVAR